VFEHRSQALAPRRIFFQRLLTSTVFGLGFLLASLLAGMIGYHLVERLNWIDSFLNASMLLGGMGPIDHERTWAGKVFEGCYALYCGIAVISAAGVILAPAVHRFFHAFHVQRPHE
jgi:uncharacterized membrane protein YciS (DUF1049 family)